MRGRQDERLTTRGRQESLDDPGVRLVRSERQAHFAGGKAEVLTRVLLQGFRLGVAEPFGDILDREARVLEQEVRIQYAGGGENVARAGQAGAREPTRARPPVHARPGGDLLNGLDGAGVAHRL